MRRLGASVAAFGAIAYATALGGDAAEPPALTVRAWGFVHSRGLAIAKLFQSGDNVIDNGRWQAAANIVNGRAEFQFRALAKGSYALVVFHDENSNGVIDHGAFGPSEPIGFSNGFTLSLISGLPTFDKLRFAYSGGAQVLEIGVR